MKNFITILSCLAMTFTPELLLAQCASCGVSSTRGIFSRTNANRTYNRQLRAAQPTRNYRVATRNTTYRNYSAGSSGGYSASSSYGSSGSTAVQSYGSTGGYNSVPVKVYESNSTTPTNLYGSTRSPMCQCENCTCENCDCGVEISGQIAYKSSEQSLAGQRAPLTKSSAIDSIAGNYAPLSTTAYASL